MFKLGKFKEAHALFNNLLLSGSETLRSYDRRLYYNKSICELQLGDYMGCIATC
jgi:hypothetical protein